LQRVFSRRLKLFHAATSGDEQAITKLLAQDTASWLDETNAKIALNSAMGHGHVAGVSTDCP